MKQLLILLLVALVALTGCVASDPWIDDIYTEASIIRQDSSGDGGYWHEYNTDILSLSPGASGAILVEPDADTMGGYQLDDDTEYIYFSTYLEADWDDSTRPIIQITFETNTDNTGGGLADVVVLDVLCYHKSEGDTACISHNHVGTTTVGQAAQYTMFIMYLEIESDVAGMSIGDTITFRINLDTVTSDVDDVILNYLEIKYRTLYPAVEY